MCIKKPIMNESTHTDMYSYVYHLVQADVPFGVACWVMFRSEQSFLYTKSEKPWKYSVIFLLSRKKNTQTET